MSSFKSSSSRAAKLVPAFLLVIVGHATAFTRQLSSRNVVARPNAVIPSPSLTYEHASSLRIPLLGMALINGDAKTGISTLPKPPNGASIDEATQPVANKLVGDTDSTSLQGKFEDISGEITSKPDATVTKSAGTLKEKLDKNLTEKLVKKENLFVLCAGLCLSFNSGYINGCCLSGLLGGRAIGVSAFTGAYTKAGLALAGGRLAHFGFEISMVLAFIFGSCISGMINPRPVANQMGPTYGPTFLLGSTLLAISSLLASLRPEGRALFYFAAVANGLQNGMSSMYSANLIRSTHLTGISTDIGMILGQMLRGNLTNVWKFVVLSGLTTFFTLGSVVSFFAVTRFRSLALAFNACFFFAIGLGCIIFTAVERKVSLWQAASGSWQWDKVLDTLSLGSKDGESVSEDFLMKLFDKIDVDGDGFIDQEELHMALNEAGIDITKRDLNVMISVVDENGDGVISREELMHLVESRKSSRGRLQIPC